MYVLVLDQVPQALDGHVVDLSASAVSADGRPGDLVHRDPGFTCGLATTIGFEILWRTNAQQGSFQRIHTRHAAAIVLDKGLAILVRIQTSTHTVILTSRRHI